jgi:HAD superfamily hydrolase (TIGR01549 family)
MIQLVSLDCAQTLIRTDWNPARIASAALREVFGPNDEHGIWVEKYVRLLQTRYPEYRLLCQSRDEGRCQQWWNDLAAEWGAGVGLTGRHLSAFLRAGDELTFGACSLAFSRFEDVVPALRAIQAAGYRMAVVSNWDITLSRVLRIYEIEQYFEIVLASDVEGFVKPDPRIFAELCRRASLEAAKILHVGDHPLEDVAAAKSAGMSALLIDRGGQAGPLRVTSLEQVLPWLQSQ